jgi:hypothetical protein
MTKGHNVKKEVKEYTFNGTLKRIYQAFFCEPKNGNGPEFSTKKFWAIILLIIAISEKIKLVYFTSYHFSVYLSTLGVSDNVIISLIVSIDGLAFGALAVYGWAKAKNAA